MINIQKSLILYIICVKTHNSRNLVQILKGLGLMEDQKWKGDWELSIVLPQEFKRCIVYRIG